MPCRCSTPTSPTGRSAPDNERELLSQLTDILLRHEGVDPTDPSARSIAKLWLHRPHAVLVGGEQPELPHYRIFVLGDPEQGRAYAEAGLAGHHAVPEATRA